MATRITKFSKRSGIADVDVLIEGYKWGGAAGTGSELTFSFAGANSKWVKGYDEAQSSLSYLTAMEKTVIKDILKMIDSYIKLDFKEVADGRKGSGDIRFAKSDIDGATGTLAHAYTPNGPRPKNGDVWFDVYDPLSDFDFGNAVGVRARVVAMHEILHALGLKHVREGAYGLDQTVMNPTIGANLGGRWFSLMPNDITALQLIYGAEKFNHGNTLYDLAYFEKNYGPNVGFGYNRYLTIWDSGGIDTIKIDYLVDISLDPNTREHDTGLMIARGAVIENFTTNRSYADVIGNSADNVIRVGGDIMTDQSYDSYNWLSHWTRVDTKEGNDTVILAREYYNSYVPSVNNSNVQVSSTFYHDIFLGRGNDVAHGSYFTDYLQGSEGHDVLYGHEGNDTLDGDAFAIRVDPKGGYIQETTGGTDTLYGGSGTDTLMGSVGRDVLYGEEDADIFQWVDTRDISTAFGAQVDVVMDFNAAEGDKIRLPIASAYTNRFIGEQSFTGRAYEIALVANSDDTWRVLVDTDGDLDSDWVIHVRTNNGEALKAADFYS